MRFKVPQFIEVEDKIFGPFSFKQFAYLVGGAGLSFLLWRTLPWWISLPLIALVVALSLSLAFFKPNNRPFVDMLESAFKFFFGNKLYLWKHGGSKVKKKGKQIAQKPSVVDVPHLSQSKLKDIAWELDIQESIYSNDTKPE